MKEEIGRPLCLVLWSRKQMFQKVVLDRWRWEGTGLIARIERSTILSREDYISEGSEMENNKTCLMSYKVHRKKAR